MTKWEYKSFTRQFRTEQPYDQNVAAWLNELGADGWEIFRMETPFNSDYTEQYFILLAKRPVDA